MPAYTLGERAGKCGDEDTMLIDQPRTADLNQTDIEAAFAAFRDETDGEPIDAAEPITPAIASEPTRTAQPVEIANTCLVEREDGTKGTKPLPMREILNRVRAATGGWPRRVGPALFIDEGDGIDWLPKVDAAFGWIGHVTGKPSRFLKGGHSKAEVFAELQRTARDYSGIAEHPHFPPYPDCYYSCGDVEPGDGETLQSLLDRFCPATPDDRQLILAMIVTLLWGGPPGSRPAFVITADEGRGCGKTRLVSLTAEIVGGAMSFERGETAERIKGRLLSAEGMSRRVCLLDNIKAERFSWAELESMVTATDISGHRWHVGEGRRANVLTWCMTLNGPSLSEDIAQRSVVIKLAKPTYAAGWLESTSAFISDNRQQLIADIAGFFQQPTTRLRSHSRWQAWEDAVLSRLPEADTLQALILERQRDANSDRDEAESIEDAFAARLSAVGFDAERDRVFIPTAVAAVWMSEATGEKFSNIGAGRRLSAMIGEKSVGRIGRPGHTGKARGFVWSPDNADASAPPHSDLESRIASHALAL